MARSAPAGRSCDPIMCCEPPIESPPPSTRIRVKTWTRRVAAASGTVAPALLSTLSSNAVRVPSGPRRAAAGQAFAGPARAGRRICDRHANVRASAPSARASTYHSGPGPHRAAIPGATGPATKGGTRTRRRRTAQAGPGWARMREGAVSGTSGSRAATAADGPAASQCARFPAGGPGGWGP